MKKMMLIAVALLALQATAQEPTREKRKVMAKERMEKFESLTPEESATLRTKQMTLDLDLTEAQQQKIQALNLEQAKARKTAMENWKKAKEEGTEKKEFSKEDRYKMMNERLDKQIEHKKQMKSILNAEQYNKWEKAHDNKGKRKSMHKRKMHRDSKTRE